MEEIWKPVIGFEDLYEVNSLGAVKGKRRSGCTGEPLQWHIDHNGYAVVCLTKGCKSKRLFVHRLVAQAFIPNPENKRTVNHKDGVKTNNSIDNLEWMTHGENHHHAYMIGLKVPTERQRKQCSELGKRTCDKNRPRTPVIGRNVDGTEMLFESAHSAARFVGGDASPIVKCCKGKKLTYKGTTWRYANASK